MLCEVCGRNNNRNKDGNWISRSQPEFQQEAVQNNKSWSPNREFVNRDLCSRIYRGKMDNYPLELKYRLQQANADAPHNLIISKQKGKVTYDQKSFKIAIYKPGNLVLIKKGLFA